MINLSGDRRDSKLTKLLIPSIVLIIFDPVTSPFHNSYVLRVICVQAWEPSQIEAFPQVTCHRLHKEY